MAELKKTMDEQPFRVARTTTQFRRFFEALHSTITTNDLYRKKTQTLSETEVQRELRAIITAFLDRHWKGKGFKNPERKRQKTFYWEGQEGAPELKRKESFGSKNYPDFIILEPYKLGLPTSVIPLKVFVTLPA